MNLYPPAEICLQPEVCNCELTQKMLHLRYIKGKVMELKMIPTMEPRM